MLRDRQVMLSLLIRGQAKMTARLAGDGIAELVEYLGQVATREIAGKASYRDDFFADMVEPNDLGRLPFVEVTADGITDFPVKFRDRVSFSENGNAERPCDEPAFRRVFYHKDQLAHGHFSKVKERTLCCHVIPDATQCLVREVSPTRDTRDERRTKEPDRHAPRGVGCKTRITLGLKSPRPCQEKIPDPFSVLGL